MAQFFPDGMRDMNMNTASNNNGNFTTPPQQDFDNEAMRGSMQQVLSENLGEFVVVEFLIGTQTMTQKQGILYAVGTSFLTLYEEQSQTFVVCDIFSVKFVTFYLPGQRPGSTGGTGFMPHIPGENIVPGPAPQAGGGCGGYRALNTQR